MRPNLRGFVDELLKLAAFPQMSEGQGPYDSAVASTLEQTQGQQARTGLRAGLMTMTPPAMPKKAPTPLTTPNSMVDVASRSG